MEDFHYVTNTLGDTDEDVFDNPKYNNELDYVIELSKIMINYAKDNKISASHDGFKHLGCYHKREISLNNNSLVIIVN